MRMRQWMCILCGLSAILGHGVPGLSTRADAQEVVVVANVKVAESSLPANLLQDMFLGDRSRWADNSRVVIAILKDGEIHEQFLKTYMRRTSSQFSTYWKRQVFTGKGKMPASFDSEADLVEFINQTEGAVGYAGASAALGEAKVITISP